MSKRAKLSAGILMYRWRGKKIEVLLAHPGGPFWVKKDQGAWSVPKGEFEEGADPLENAIREFKEETGQELNGEFIALTPLKQKSGKKIYAWMVEGDLDPAKLISNHFELEWPPKSGKINSFPEVDRVEWFTPEVAREKIIPGQSAFIDELEDLLKKD